MPKKKIIIVGWDKKYTNNLSSVLEKQYYSPILVSSFLDAKAHLDKDFFQIMLIDLDQMTLDNRTLKELRKEYPVLGLIALSSRWFHQELEEAMSRYIDACFDKSDDYEDILYWLKAVFDPAVVQEDRGKR